MKIQLYIKTHNYTGIKYFGKHKLCSTSVYDYQGSGTDWSKHLAKYGDDCLTYVLGTWDESDPRLEVVALSFSMAHNIVESDKWANMMLENGLDGSWDYVNSLPRTWDSKPEIAFAKGRKTQKWLRENDEEWVKTYSANLSLVHQKRYLNGYVDKGWTQSKEAVNNQKATHKKNKHQQGFKNSQYGKVWIYNDDVQKSTKIFPKHIETWFLKGWSIGRKMKFDAL